MLSHLLIKNYALIEHLEMDPDTALNTITGETGAGKSIMLGAIGLLMGNRADSKALYNPTDKCIIEGFFDVSGYVIENLFEEENLDYESTCVVRREISPSGKSRAFVNDTPVTLDILRRVTSQLMDIHSQHDSILLGSNEYQLQIVDTYAQNDALLRQYRSDYRTFRLKQEAYEHLLNETATMKKEFDYNHFLYEELHKLELQTDEQEQLEQELTILENAEDIKERLQLSSDYLDNAEQSVVVYLKNAVNNLNYVSRLTDRFSQIRDRAQSSLIELRDLANEISTEEENIETNDARVEVIRERLNLIYNLQTKHAVKTIAELLTIQAELEKKVSKILNSDEELAQAKAENEAAEKQLMTSARVLTASRQAVIPQIEKQVDSSLADLGMPNASLKINVETGKPTYNGVDTVSFLFSANKGVKPQQLKNVASGGEFSRLMMTIKYILASKRSLPTIIFDEIDTGVSGEIAIKMGNMMREMSHSHQIIAITHLHQIAAQGKAHYYVYKDNSGNKTVSRVKKLNFNERVQEIAQMIGGNNPSASVLKNAKELLSQKAAS